MSLFDSHTPLLCTDKVKGRRALHTAMKLIDLHSPHWNYAGYSCQRGCCLQL